MFLHHTILPSNALHRHVTIQYLRHVPTLCPTMSPFCRRDARSERPGNVVNTRPLIACTTAAGRFPTAGTPCQAIRRHATRKVRNKHLRNTGKGTPTEKRVKERLRKSGNNPRKQPKTGNKKSPARIGKSSRGQVKKGGILLSRIASQYHRRNRA